jgi:hypothetical protein
MMNETEIETWAIEHDFDALTPEQQWFVLEKLGSKEAFARMRRSLLAAGSALAAERAELVPAPATLVNLREAMDRRKRTRPSVAMGESLLGRILSWRMPAYQAALGAVAIAALVFLLRPAAPQVPTHIVERIVQVPVQTHDTVRVQTLDDATIRRITDSAREEMRALLAATRREESHRALRTGRDVTVQSPAPNDREPEQEQPASASPQSSGRNRFVGLANLPQLDVQKRGKSLAEDSAFNRFAVSLGEPGMGRGQGKSEK